LATRIAIAAALAVLALVGLLLTDRGEARPADVPVVESAPFRDLPIAARSASAPPTRPATPPVRMARGANDGAPEAFAIAPIETRWDATCDDHPELRFDDVRQAVLDTGLDPGARFPSTGHVVDFAQAYELEGRRAQLTAEWNYDAPARYELRVLQFDDDEFANPRPLAIEGSATTVDASDLAPALRALDRRLRARGATPTERGTVVANYLPAADEPPDLGAEHAFVVEMRNGRIVRYHAQGVACHGRDDVATCYCPPEDEHAPE